MNKAICRNMDGPRFIILNEVNFIEKEKYHITYLHITYIWNLKKKEVDTSELIYKTEQYMWILKINLCLAKGKDEVGEGIN